MNVPVTKDDLISSIGSLLTSVRSGNIKTTTDFGSFYCSIEDFDQFAIVKRNFSTGSDPISIPFSCDELSIQMIFSLDGHSFFNDRFNPYILSPVSHCLNLYKYYECRNLLDANAQQHDITFRLRKSFYSDLLTNHLESSEDRLPSMILQQKEFNTINEHIPADAAILGILRNIVGCPFKGDMKMTFIREHLRALLTLQLFHFNPVVAGKQVLLDRKISKRDVDVLQEVKRHIDLNFLNPASLETLSRHFGINQFKLKHGFKTLFNTSPIRYLQYKRLEYSLFLLRETDKSIAMIADEVGYSHGANYTAAFTRTFGNPPQYYRSGRHYVSASVETEESVG